MSHPSRCVAILYQALPPPMVHGVRKPMKKGGYADSGADIAYVLREAGVDVATPVATPRTNRDLDWVFPDTEAGIKTARAAGAEILWANTILFNGHPLEAVADQVRVVGQPPELVDAFDDKWIANDRLRQQGCPVAKSVVLGLKPEAGVLPLEGLTPEKLASLGFRFPLVLKPKRGRGSQGVMRVSDFPALSRGAMELFTAKTMADGVESPTFGETVILEEYLDGDEITITVMPPGRYQIQGREADFKDYWPTPPVLRFNHQDGIAPYNGVVNVVENSRVLSPEEMSSPAVIEIVRGCVRASEIIAPKAPIRIDCRRSRGGPYQLFDFNMKPNMTGAGRPGREQQDSLTCMAARAMGWSYADLLLAMLGQAWQQRRKR